MATESRTTIIVAVIGLAGALGVALIGNWDRISPPVEETTMVPEDESPPPAVLDDSLSTEARHCAEPTIPVLSAPGENDVVPNHYYGQGKPWSFEWLESSCEGGSIRGYRIIVKAVGAITPAVDEIVEEPRYIGDTTGTVGARDWTWRVRAIDDRNQLSEWSEERRFVVPAWTPP